ncbi:MAG: DUF1566 domain-containing protein [Nitrospinaceae bacterium]
MSDKTQFVDNGDGTIQDNRLNIAWSKRDSWQIHQDWLDFDEAMAFIDQLNRKDYLGFHDWRMPERKEIENLFLPEVTIKARSNADIHLPDLFEANCGNGSWVLPFDQQAAFYFSYSSGLSQHYDKDFSQGYVRPVRLWGDE